MNKSISIKEVILVDGKPQILGSVGETQFTAGLLQWGSKVLIKVEGNDLDRGLRIAIGPASIEPLDLVVDPTPAVDLTKLTVPQLKARAKSQGLKGYSDMNKPQLLVLLG